MALSQWTHLEAIHASLSQRAPLSESVSPQSWHSVIGSSLSATTGSPTCQASPATCQHCHQLSALSAVISMTLIVKETEDRRVEELYLRPLLQPATLTPMVCLLHQPCPHLRYQARRCLACLLTLPDTQDSSVVLVMEACVTSVLQQPRDASLCLEPLHLLGILLSPSQGGSINTTTAASLLPHLDRLYRYLHGCHRAHVATGESCLAEKGRDDLSAQAGEPSHCKISETPPCSDFSSQEIDMSTGCSGKIPLEDSLSFKSVAESDDFSQPLGVQPRRPDSSALPSFPSQPSCSVSSHTDNVRYMVLSVVQKTVKLFKSLDREEQSSYLPPLRSLISLLIADYVPSTGNLTHAGIAHRKCLHVLDTLFDRRTATANLDQDSLCVAIAVQFVRCFQNSDCSWRFPGHRTFIGGEVRAQRPSPGSGERAEGQEKKDGGKLERKDSNPGREDCNPSLILLLSVVLKSCAIVVTNADKRDVELVAACLTIIRSTHAHLCHLSPAHPAPHLCHRSPTDQSPGQTPSHLDWLPAVCGQQDDRWVQGLLCLLDMALGLQARHPVFDDATLQTTLTLVNPHRLFLQLVHATHFDPSLLIDWLTSPETPFLAYLTRYLRLMAADFPAFRLAAGIWAQQAYGRDREGKVWGTGWGERSGGTGWGERSGGTGWGERSGDTGWGERSGGTGWGERSGGTGWGERSGDTGWGERSGGTGWGERSGDTGWGERSGGTGWGERSGGTGWGERSGDPDTRPGGCPGRGGLDDSDMWSEGSSEDGEQSGHCSADYSGNEEWGQSTMCCSGDPGGGNSGDFDMGCDGGSQDGDRGGSDMGCDGGSQDGDRGGSDMGCDGGSQDGDRGDSDMGCDGGSQDGDRGGSDMGCDGGSQDGDREESGTGSPQYTGNRGPGDSETTSTKFFMGRDLNRTSPDYHGIGEVEYSGICLKGYPRGEEMTDAVCHPLGQSDSTKMDSSLDSSVLETAGSSGKADNYSISNSLKWSSGLALLSCYNDADDSEDSEGDVSDEDDADCDQTNGVEDKGNDGSFHAVRVRDGRDFDMCVTGSRTRLNCTTSKGEENGQTDTQHCLTVPSTQSGETIADVCVARVMVLLSSLHRRLERLQERGLLVYNCRPLLVLLARCHRLDH